MTRYTKSMREAMLEVWANDITLDEGKMKTIATMFAQGKSAEEIAAKMTLPVATVKTILGEDDVKEQMLWEFTDAQITKLKKDYASLKGTKISLARANQLRNIFDKITDTQLPKLYKADIPFLSTMSLSRMIKKGIQVPKGVRISAFREQTWEEILKDENAVSIAGIETSTERTQLDEKFQPGFAVRYALDGKRKVQAYKTQKDADHRAKILKSMGGVKDVSVTKHDLNFKEEDFKVFNEYAEYIEYMAKNSGQAKAIANMFKGKTGGGESNADGSEVRIDSAKDVENIHKQVIAKYGDDVRVLTKEELEEVVAEGKGDVRKLADTLTRFVMGDRGAALSSLQRLRRDTFGTTEKDSGKYNTQYNKLYTSILNGLKQNVGEQLEEAIKPYMISYSQYGKHYGFESGNSLADIQNIAQKLRAKGYTIDKMGKYNPPLDKKLRTGKTGIESDMTPADIERLKKQGLQAESYTVQITKSDGSKLVIGKYSTTGEAEKYISWYKTGDMSKTKSVKVIKEASNTIYKIKKDGKVVFTGKYNQVLTYRKQHGGEIVTEEAEPKKTFAGFKKENSKDKETDIDKIKLAKEKDTDTLEAQVTTLKGQVALVKQKLEIEKNKVVKPVPDKETGEVPLAIGLAQKLLRDKAQKETKKESVEEDVKVKFAMNKDQKIATATYKDKKSAKDFIKSILSKGGKAILGEAKWRYEFTISSDSGADGDNKSDEGTLQASSEKDAENKAEKIADKFTAMWNKRKSSIGRPGNFSPEDIFVYQEEYVSEGPEGWALVSKAKDIAKKMAGNLTGAVKAIEKLQKGLSKNSSVEQALKTANESIEESFAIYAIKSFKDRGMDRKSGDRVSAKMGYTDAVKKAKQINVGSSVGSEKRVEVKPFKEVKEAMPGGANSSSRKGSVWRKAKKYRFGMKVGEKEPKGDKELEEIRIKPKNAIGETDLSKSQTKKVHKKADDLPKKSFRDRYGKKKGDSIRFAVATNQAKKKLGIENKNHPAKKKWEALTAKQKKKEDDNSKDILPLSQEPTQKTDPMNIQSKEPEKKRTDNGTKSDKIDVNPRIDYQA